MKDFKFITLIYHRVNPDLKPGRLNVLPDDFKDQMNILKETAEVIGLEGIRLKEKSKNKDRIKVALTFDDGYRDNYIYAYPILKRMKMKSIICLISGMIGTNLKRKRYEALSDPDMLSFREVNEMAQYDAAFIAHTKTHRHLNELSYREKQNEIQDSIDGLKKKIIKNFFEDFFCYPYGEMDRESLGVLKDLGVKYAFSIQEGCNTSDTDPLALKRIWVDGAESLDQFVKKIKNSYNSGKS